MTLLKVCVLRKLSAQPANSLRSASHFDEERDHAPRHEHQQHPDSACLAKPARETRYEGPSTADRRRAQWCTQVCRKISS